MPMFIGFRRTNNLVILTHNSVASIHYSVIGTHHSVTSTHYKVMNANNTVIRTHNAVISTHHGVTLIHYGVDCTRNSVTCADNGVTSTQNTNLRAVQICADYNPLTTHHLLPTAAQVSAADAGRGGEVYVGEFGVIGGADRFAVVGIEIFVDGFDHL